MPTPNNGVCVPIVPAIAPLRLASDYRDYFGRAHERLVELIDPILNAGCFHPKIFHAPDTEAENIGLDPNGYLEYAVELPAGSFLLGYLHTMTGDQASTDPPLVSTFRVQITDVARNFKFFQKPVPEAYFLNGVPSSDPSSVYAGEGLYVTNPAPRLLPAPYPIAPPGQLMFQFWNLLDTTNNLVQLSMVVAVPDEADYDG